MSLPVVTSANYFDPAIEQAYMGHTQYVNFTRCEAASLARVRGEWRDPPSKALLVGSYVDAHFEGSLAVFRAQHPEIFKRDGALKAEYQEADALITRMEADRLYSLLMSGEKQVICTGEIAGIPFKIKIDSLLGADTCRQIVEEFPHTAAAMGLCDGAIVDQKAMRNLEPVWSDEERRKVSFVQGWGYDVEGAVYQAVEGNMLPFILAVGTKEDPPDLAALHIPDDALQEKLYEIEDTVPRYQAIKEGREKPHRCEHCAYCRATRALKSIVDFRELDASWAAW